MIEIIRRQFGRNGWFLLAATGLLALFEFILCAVVASMDLEATFAQLTTLAPPLIRAMIEQNMPGGSPADVLSFGWNHPVAHALLTAIAITLPARAIAGEIENGVIELVMAQPISRAQYFAAHVIFGAGAISAVIVGGLFGTALGQAIFSLNAFGWERMAGLYVNAFLLQLAIYSLTLAVSAFGREAGRVAVAGVLIAVVSFLVNAITMLWAKAEFLKPFSLHAYFIPREVLAQGHLAISSVLVLTTVAALAMAVAYSRFAARDLP